MMKHLLIIILSILLMSSPFIGQSSKSSTGKIKRMLDSGMSVDEIKQVFKKILNRGTFKVLLN